MKNPQVVSISGENPDTVIVVWGEYVINDTTQIPVTTEATLVIDIDLFDITTGAAVATVSAVTMTYQAASGFWSIPCQAATALGSALTDRHKYVAKISKDATETYDLREFFLDEFAVDNNSFEETLARLPFEVRELSGNMHLVWYDSDAHIGNLTYAVYKAPAYEGGTGTVYATDPSRVTHRGAIVTY